MQIKGGHANPLDRTQLRPQGTRQQAARESDYDRKTPPIASPSSRLAPCRLARRGSSNTRTARNKMSNNVGGKALDGEWEDIGAYMFSIEEDVTMSFEGMSCNIIKDGEIIHNFSKASGLVEGLSISAGTQCFVMNARVKFLRK